MLYPVSHLSNRALWGRIAGAHLPVERDGGSFADHLAEIAGLSAPVAHLLEREYRRFLYLAVIAPGARVPSGLVRLAWSYHADHEAYGAEFSTYVLGRALPFAPASGASPAAYDATLRAYQREFGTAAPGAIWPAAHVPASLPHWHGGDVGALPIQP